MQRIKLTYGGIDDKSTNKIEKISNIILTVPADELSTNMEKITHMAIDFQSSTYFLNSKVVIFSEIIDSIKLLFLGSLTLNLAWGVVFCLDIKGHHVG
jgi:hypothetical protein